MKKTLAILILVVSAQHAFADDNYYLCTNTDATSTAPANILVLAGPQLMAGELNAANPSPPRAVFQAPPVSGGTTVTAPAGETVLTFGKVQWQGSSNGLPDFSAAAVYFNATTDVMVQAVLTYPQGAVAYGNCQVQSN